MNSPCHGCTKRKPGTGCHDRCEEYKAFRKELDELNRKMHLEAEYHHMKKDIVTRTKENIRKHRDRRS